MDNQQKKKSNELKTYKNVIGLAALLIGSQVGAGYASGREIVGFFGDYGWFNFILFVVLLSGYFLLLNTYIKVSKLVKANNITDLTKVAFGKFNFLANLLLFIAMFAGLSATLAGLDSVAQMTFNTYNFPWLSILIGGIVVIVVSGGLKSVLKLANIAVPLLITVLLVTTFYFLLFGSHTGVELAPQNVSLIGAGLISTVFYIGSNLNSAGTLITQIHDKFEQKTIKLSAFLFIFFFATGILIVINSLYLSTNTIFQSDMPLALLAGSISSALGVVYRVALFLAITMTLTAVSFTLTNWFNVYIKNRLLTVIIIVGSGFLVSRLGFAAIIDYIYPIKGAGGLIVGVGIYIYYLKNKRKLNKKDH